MSAARLTVATLNVLSPEHAEPERRIAVLRDGLARAAPDLIALQEVTEDEIARLLGPGYHVACHSGRSGDGVGAALASRWPLRAVHEIDLHVTERVDLPWCAAVVAEIDAPPPFGPLLFVHHKPSYQWGFSRERELQAMTCARFVEQRLSGRDLHVILAGDFDDTPDAACIRFWTGKQSLFDVAVAYRDAWEATRPGDPGHTFTPANPLVTAGEMALEPGRRIDYVMVRCGIHGPTLRVADCRLLFDQPVDGVWASDHFGVLAELAVPGHRPGRWI